MTNKELIEQLSKFDLSEEVIVFAEGELFPTLVVDILEDGRIEIGCGWAELEDEKDN